MRRRFAARGGTMITVSSVSGRSPRYWTDYRGVLQAVATAATDLRSTHPDLIRIRGCTRRNPRTRLLAGLTS